MMTGGGMFAAMLLMLGAHLAGWDAANPSWWLLGTVVALLLIDCALPAARAWLLLGYLGEFDLERKQSRSPYDRMISSGAVRDDKT